MPALDATDYTRGQHRPASDTHGILTIGSWWTYRLDGYENHDGYVDAVLRMESYIGYGQGEGTFEFDVLTDASPAISEQVRRRFQSIRRSDFWKLFDSGHIKLLKQVTV